MEVGINDDLGSSEKSRIDMLALVDHQMLDKGIGCIFAYVPVCMRR